jgi:hypothetical protein
MSKHFGKARVPDCRCEFNFTCGPCLQAAVDKNTADKQNAPVIWFKTSRSKIKTRFDNVKLD